LPVAIAHSDGQLLTAGTTFGASRTSSGLAVDPRCVTFWPGRRCASTIGYTRGAASASQGGLEIVPRSAVAIALPGAEFIAVREHLAEAGYEAISVGSADDLDLLLTSRTDVHVAILDCESDFDGTLEMYAVLHEGGRNVPALMLMPPRALGRMGMGGGSEAKDEYFTRPYSAESLRWRVEAMLIRVESVPADAHPDDDRVGNPVEAHASAEAFQTYAGSDIDVSGNGAGHKRGKIVIVFNPKGGVGKTTISINMGAALQMHKRQRVLLVDCDTITGHIASSLGMQRPRTLADAWREGAKTGVEEPVAQIATVHSSGVSVLVMAESPLHTEILEPKRVSDAICAARDSYDWVILDMHPDYGPLNQALFEQADRILVPVTPDVPCIRAAVQFREIAAELAISARLTIVINRAKSGVASSDVERVVALPALARVRSAGMLFVRAADEGKSAVERFPTSRVVGDIDTLADRLLSGVDLGDGARPGFPSRSRIAGSFKGLFDRLTTQVS
jgi:MinD-like ATPase involved in chromosome partitioning or flagellar assembly